MFTTGLGPVADSAFTVTTMLIAIPTAVKIFNWLATLWGGHLVMTTAMHFAVGFVALFTIGGLSGVMHASPPIDYHHQDSYFVVAHIHYVLFGGSIFGLFAGIYYWFPKFSGRLLNEALGKTHFWLMFFAMNVAFFPMHFLGVDGMPRRVYTYAAADGWSLWNLVSTLGAFALGASILVFIYNALASLRSGERAGADPWDGATLEWATSSPPPVHDFDRIPSVTSARPFWDKKYGGAGPEPEEAEEHIHMPPPSFWPLISAVGIFVFWLGFILPGFQVAVSIAGVVILLAGIYCWAFEPTD